MKRTLVTIAGATALATIRSSARRSQPPNRSPLRQRQRTRHDRGRPRHDRLADLRRRSGTRRAPGRCSRPSSTRTATAAWCVKQYRPSVGISNKWTDGEITDYVVTGSPTTSRTATAEADRGSRGRLRAWSRSSSSPPGSSAHWLAAHHATETEVLVGFHKKATGRPTMTWSESVDEALCFGWIDGRRNSLGT